MQEKMQEKMEEKKEEKSRAARLQMIRGILDSMRVESQSELLMMLEQQGFPCTQATLSRDFRQLHVAKRRLPSGKKYYIVPKPKDDRYRVVVAEVEKKPQLTIPGFKSIAFSGNMAVIKTLPGYASSVAYHIDECELPDILGTIAGDDTVFCVITDVVPVELIHKLEICLNERS